MSTGCKYTHLDPAPDSTHSLVLAFVPPKSRVLEFGCATGYMSQVLRERLSCSVVGIELSAEAAEAAREHCDEVIVGDAELIDYEAALGERRFDVVLFADVLEHLRDPGGVLERVRPFLADGGVVVASVPNVAHGSVRLALLTGDFRYRELGLLDDTHLRFLTRDTLNELFEEHGYAITDWVRKQAGVDETEIGVAWDAVPHGLREWIERDPESMTYQFVVRAVPAEKRRPADEPAPRQATSPDGLPDREADHAWLTRALLRAADAVDLGADEHGPEEPEPHTIPELDAARDAEAYRRWLERTQDGPRRAEGGPTFTVVPADADLAARLEQARTDYVVFVEPGGELAPEALDELALAVAEDPSMDVLYVDEDELADGGVRDRPFFKPDWCPDYLLSFDYLGGLLAVRRQLLGELGGLSAERPMYDLALRATERAARIGHVPKILFHRRPAGTPNEAEAEHGRRVVEEALRRRGEGGQVFRGTYTGTYRVRRPIDGSPFVSVIVPYKDGADLLRACVDGLHDLAGYDRWEALLVDNGSWEPETAALRRQLAEDAKCRLLEFDAPFNWAAVNNWAAEQAEGELLLFLNNDVEGVANGWLEAMVEQALRPEVGAVGARLLYPDGRIQHAGVLVGVGSVADHAFRFAPADEPGYFFMPSVIRDYSAVTGACMMVRKDTFAELRGFDEKLAVAYNDIDFCLRLRERGYLVVYTPFAELTHHESLSRGRSTDEPEARIMVERWSSYIKDGDPYSNPNLSRRRPDFALAQENEVTPWEILTSSLKS